MILHANQIKNKFLSLSLPCFPLLQGWGRGHSNELVRFVKLYKYYVHFVATLEFGVKVK